MVLARSFDSRFADRSALSFLPSLLRFPALVWANRYMVQNFLRRDLMSRVNGSMLGLGWLLLRPMALFALYYLVFGLVLGPRVGDSKQPDPYFALYLFSGVIAFHALSEATTVACSIVVDNGNLVKKVAFPSEVLIVHVALVAQVIYAVGVVVVLGAGLAMGLQTPGWLLLALPLTMFLQFVLSLGMGMLLANLNVFSRDTSQLWGLVAQGWMFLSPVFLLPSQLEGPVKDGHLPVWGPGLVEALNPAWALMQAQRLALGGPSEVLGAFWPQVGIAAAWAFGFLVLGYTVFMSRKHKFADLI